MIERLVVHEFETLDALTFEISLDGVGHIIGIGRQDIDEIQTVIRQSIAKAVV